jgi:hypothetical protein
MTLRNNLIVSQRTNNPSNKAANVKQRRPFFRSTAFAGTAMLFSVMLSSCAAPTLSFKDIAETQRVYGIQNLPTQKDYPDADAVVILDATDVITQVESQKLRTYNLYHVIKKVFRNVDKEAVVTLPVFAEEELLDIKARTIRPDGQIVELQPKDFYTTSGIGGSSLLYSDIKTVRFTFSGADKDCLLEYAFEKRNDRPFVSDVWEIQNTEPTLRSQYSLTMPLLMMAIVPYRYKTYAHATQVEPVRNEAPVKGRITLDKPVTVLWVQKDVPAFEEEDLMPPADEYRAHVKFALSSWLGWNGLAQWYYKSYFEPQLVISDSIRALAKRLTVNCKTSDEQLRAIYHYVQKIRYIAIQLGQSGLQPSTPQTVLDRQYGDCKDKSILCISLLKAVGIHAVPVLALTANVGVLDAGFPSWKFNHMIVKAELEGGKKFWLDPTSEFSPLGTLPWVDQAIQVMPIADDGSGTIEVTPLEDFNKNYTAMKVNADLHKDQSAQFTVTTRCAGEEARYYRYLFQDKTSTELKELCRKMIVNPGIRADFDTVIVSNQEAIDSTLVFTFTFHTPDALIKQADLYMYNIDILRAVPNLDWTVKEKRKYPIWFPFLTTIQKSFVISIPDSAFQLRSVPDPIYTSNERFYYSKSYQKGNASMMTAQEVFTIKKVEIEPKDYKDVRSFFQDVKLKSEQPIVFTHK